MSQNRGFKTMDPVKQREIASKGGKAAHQKGTAHEWTSEEGAAASQRAIDNRAARRVKTHPEGAVE